MNLSAVSLFLQEKWLTIPFQASFSARTYTTWPAKMGYRKLKRQWIPCVRELFKSCFLQWRTPQGLLNTTSVYPWRSNTIRSCLQARVAAFGSQDIGFQDLGIWLWGPGFQDLESSPSYGRLIFFPSLFSASTATFLLRPVFPSLFSASIFSASTVTFLCFQWTQTDEPVRP